MLGYKPYQNFCFIDMKYVNVYAAKPIKTTCQASCTLLPQNYKISTEHLEGFANL